MKIECRACGNCDYWEKIEEDERTIMGFCKVFEVSFFAHTPICCHFKEVSREMKTSEERKEMENKVKKAEKQDSAWKNKNLMEEVKE